jgi:type III secretory pathway component EscV
MKTVPKIIMAMFLAAALSGCSSFLGGGAAGVAGTSAGYEYSANRQLKKLDDDLKAGRIDQKEYDTRKDQIKRGSLIY